MKSLYIIVHIGLLMSLVDATKLSGNVASQDDQCPSWTRPVNNTDGNISCECGDDIGGIVTHQGNKMCFDFVVGARYMHVLI